MMKIALTMLIADKAKYFMLVSAIAFSTFLMTQQLGVFLGAMRAFTAQQRNVNVPIRVVDWSVQRDEYIPIRNINYEIIRSMDDVEWAMPMSDQTLYARTYLGNSILIRLLGVDGTTLLGAPGTMIKGSIKDLWQDGGVLVDENFIQTFSEKLSKPLDVGDTFDINGHQVTICGIFKAELTPQLMPSVFTTFDRSLEISSSMQNSLSIILVKPKPNVLVEPLCRKIEELTQLRAYSSEAFFWTTTWWYIKYTGIALAFGVTVFFGFIIGMVIAGQTFYSFILSNLRSLGSLKVMGASDVLLRKMIIFQAAVTGFIGFGIGLIPTTCFAVFSQFHPRIPFYANWVLVLFGLFMVLIICVFSAYLGINKVNSLQPSDMFK